jgi:two-component system phosphate regulon sensor histidine kinase PhoR
LRKRADGPAVWAKRRVQTSLITLCVLLIALLASGAIAASRLYHSAENRYVGVVLPLTTLTRDVVLQMTREESGTRAYLITSDRRSLAPYFAGRAGVRTDIRQIAALSRSQPVVAARLQDVRRQVTALHGFYDRLIVFVADGMLGQQRARQEVLDGEGLQARFKRTTALMETDIRRVTLATRDEQRGTFHRALDALAVVGFFALAIAVTLVVTVPEQLRVIYAAEEDARRGAEEGANSARALAHVSDAVMLVDDVGVIRSWNAAAEQLFGISSADALGRRASGVVIEYDALREADEVDDVLVPVTIGGTERWLARTLSTFDGGSVLTVRDATAGYLLERARSDFVATASHELRTPLTSIYGGIRTLNGRGDELSVEERDGMLRLIEQESVQLVHIVDQMLISTQLDRHQLRLNASEFELSGLCSAVVASALARTSAETTVTLDAPNPIIVRCDESLLRQVLVNLIDNAIKYSRAGGQVEVRLREGLGRVRIEIRDEGPGIPATEQERIFEKFYRLDPAMQGGVGGTGLGLYISRAIITEMGGSLTVRSIPGEGSTFTVTLVQNDPSRSSGDSQESIRPSSPTS